jgi:hypothetical protein
VKIGHKEHFHRNQSQLTALMIGDKMTCIQGPLLLTPKGTFQRAKTVTSHILRNLSSCQTALGVSTVFWDQTAASTAVMLLQEMGILLLAYGS